MEASVTLPVSGGAGVTRAKNGTEDRDSEAREEE